MPRPKGSPNKITSEVRSKLQDLLDDLIDSLDLDEWTITSASKCFR